MLLIRFTISVSLTFTKKEPLKIIKKQLFLSSSNRDKLWLVCHFEENGIIKVYLMSDIKITDSIKLLLCIIKKPIYYYNLVDKGIARIFV